MDSDGALIRVKRSNNCSLWIATAALCLTAAMNGQPPPGGRGGRGGRGGPPQTPRAAAAIDMTGYWVSVVTEDWKFRMVTPPKGSFGGVPLNPEGRRVANAWDPAKDEAAGQQGRAYGAAAIMRVPGRLHITWENDATLRIDTDAGTQTRLFHFDGQPAPAGAPQWQGYSAADWQRFGGGRGVPLSGGYLKVETTHMRPGYLRKNGVPYSGNAVLQEYFTRVTEPDGTSFLFVTSVLSDPLYMNG